MQWDLICLYCLQVRSQDAYYVLQGLGAETRETAWLWLKVKSLLLCTERKKSDDLFDFSNVQVETVEPVSSIGFLFKF
jgi:hypothetical protein